LFLFSEMFWQIDLLYFCKEIRKWYAKNMYDNECGFVLAPCGSPKQCRVLIKTRYYGEWKCRLCNTSPEFCDLRTISFAAFYLARQLGSEVQCASRTTYCSNPIIRQLTPSVHISHSVLCLCIRKILSCHERTFAYFISVTNVTVIFHLIRAMPEMYLLPIEGTKFRSINILSSDRL